MGSHSRSFVNLSSTNINGFNDNKNYRVVPDPQRQNLVKPPTNLPQNLENIK